MPETLEEAPKTESGNTLWEGFTIPDDIPKATPEAPTGEAQEPIPQAQEAPSEPEKVKSPVVTLKEPSVASRENFAKQGEAKKAAELKAQQMEEKAKSEEERANKIQAEYDAAQARLKEFEQKFLEVQKFNPEEFTAKERKYQEQLQAMDENLRRVALEKHPAFVAKYDGKKAEYVNILKQMALSSGVTEEEFQASVHSPQKLWEIQENLSPYEKHQWNAAAETIAKLDQERVIDLKNHQETLAQLEQQELRRRQEDYTKQLNTNREIAKTVFNEPFEKMPFLNEDAELKADLDATREALMGGEGAENWPQENILRHVAAAKVYGRLLRTQSDQLKAAKEEAAELKKKVEEQDAFIRERHGSIPKNEVNGGAPATEKKVPFWQDIKVIRS